jgi:hypothetical protein
LWHFHMFMYYNPNWFISSFFPPFYHSSLLRVISTGLKILYLFLYRKYINHIHLLNFLLLFSLSWLWSPLSMTWFS